MNQPLHQKAAVVVAGGSGKRMKSKIPKQFLPLVGCPVLVHTLKCFLEYDNKLSIALVLPQSSFNEWEYISHRWLTELEKTRICVCEGGNTRTESVSKGLKKLAELYLIPDKTWIAIQDGVRPFATRDILDSAFKTAQEFGASVACVPVKGSLRYQESPGISKAIDRSQYLEVQTPQTFLLKDILEVFERRPHDQFTDDASLYEYAGKQVAISMGSYDNIKITTPDDLDLAEKIYHRAKDEFSHQKGVVLRDIKLLLLDVDGTLTDGGLWISPQGEMVKKFYVKDSLAIRRLIHRRQMEVGLISSGTTPHILAEIAKEWGIQLTHAGKVPKIQIVERWVQELGIDFGDIAYIGDDLNDLAVMMKVGLSACPADASKEILASADIVLKRKGGEGCVREFIEEVMKIPLG